MYRPIALLLASLLVLAPPSQVGAQSTAPVAAPAGTQAIALSPEQARAAIGLLQNDAQRAALIATLGAIAAAPPATPADASAGAAPAEPAPGATSPVSSPPAAPPASPLIVAPALAAALPVVPDGLAAQLLSRAGAVSDELTTQIATTARAVVDVPVFVRWARRTWANPAARATLLRALGQGGLVLLAAVVADALVRLLLARPRAALLRAAQRVERAARRRRRDSQQSQSGTAIDLAEAGATGPDPEPPLAEPPGEPVQAPGQGRAAALLLRRTPYALLRLLLDLVPLAMFASIAQGGEHLITSIAGGAIVREIGGAYLVARVVLCVVDALLAPRAGSLRLLSLATPGARFVKRWARRLIVTGAVVYTLPAIGRIFGLYPAADDSLLKFGGLVVHLLALAMIWQARVPVAAWLAGSSRADAGGLSTARVQFAESWHWIATVLLFGLWLIYAMALANGAGAVLHFLLVTAVVLGAARMASILLDGALVRMVRVQPSAAAPLTVRLHAYGPPLRHLLRVLILACTALALLQVWGVNVASWFGAGALGGRLLATMIRLGFAAAVGVVVWELLNLALGRQLARLNRSGEAVRAARLRTLLPMLRTTLMSTLVVIIGLNALAEIGVDIGPLLAGAGIIGVAIGFGSQKMVQDLITGIFLLLENAVQVGDTVTLAGLTGVVEHLSIRTIRLRAPDGSVHIIPFSTVGTVTNLNRGISQAQISVDLEFDEDVERVFEALRTTAAELRGDAAFADRITGDLAILGVDKVDSAGVVVLAQIQCTDGGRWAVQREFNRRWKSRVAELDIQLARRAQELTLRHPLDLRIARAPNQQGSDHE